MGGACIDDVPEHGVDSRGQRINTTIEVLLFLCDARRGRRTITVNGNAKNSNRSRESAIICFVIDDELRTFDVTDDTSKI